MRTLATAPSVALLTEFDCELINHILFNIGVFFCMLLWRNFSRLPELESLLAGQGEETPCLTKSRIGYTLLGKNVPHNAWVSYERYREGKWNERNRLMIK